jgi:uncharacterized protein (TIGR02646 family)
MRKITRPELKEKIEKALHRKQSSANKKKAAGTLNVEATWKSARQTIPVKAALDVLQKMAGERQRCMYCGDSHGTDIEHFWPKKPHPERMFLWPNLLLCCTECGRFKGDDFPLANNLPLLVDPTAEDPWQYLDFDPATGNIVARFDIATNDWLAKGTETVKTLHLDCREALAASYQRSHRRLVALVESALREPAPDATVLVRALHEADDHGMLGWCLTGTGKNVEPFASLRQNHQAAWQCCVRSIT